jgi:hypothetical protein
VAVLTIPKLTILAVAVFFPLAAPSMASTQVPAAIAAPGETLVMTLHAEGAQIYDCKAGAGGKPAWQFREPIATLLMDGKTVGRHFAGPSWELAAGGRVVGKEVAHAAGATPKDIPWLKLAATSQPETGGLTGTTTIERLNTKGGVAQGSCDQVGTFLSVPYSADYAFLKKHG